MQPPDLLSNTPVPELMARVRAELGATFAGDRPMRISRAPGRLDVMGGIADYTGATVCQRPLDCAAAVALQGRDDRHIQVFSFNLFDEHKPFTLQVPIEALLHHPAQTLRQEFDQPGRQWAAYLVGTLFILHDKGYIDLHDADVKGFNLALLSTVPMGAGLGSSAAIEVAAMMGVIDHYGIARADEPTDGAIDPMRLAELCREVETRLIGTPGSLADQVASCIGTQGRLLRMACQPHEVQSSLDLPADMRLIGIHCNVKHATAGNMYVRTRCAAFMAHRMILEKMRQMGAKSGHELIGDPLNGYLANLAAEDYKQLFRPFLPESIPGIDFLEQYGPTIDSATVVNPAIDYHVQHAADHHVLDAMRMRNFAKFMQEAAAEPDRSARGRLLDKVGHLMYASHLSYTNDAMLGVPECDLLVDLVRRYEPSGLYGAKITGTGGGGTVAVLADISSASDEAIARIAEEYEQKTGKKADVFQGSSNGAWHLGTQLV